MQGMFLQCDAPGCDHVEQVDGISEEHIGKECPKCGANLLTEEDFEDFRPMADLINVFNKAGLTTDDPTRSDLPTVSMHTHKGKTTIAIDKRKEE